MPEIPKPRSRDVPRPEPEEAAPRPDTQPNVARTTTRSERAEQGGEEAR